MTEVKSLVDQNEIYYVISMEEYEVPNGDETVSIMIEGKPYKKDNIFVAKRMDRDSTAIYTFFPNHKIWIRNTGVEESFWQLANVGGDPVAYEEITKEIAYELADEMRDYNEFIAQILVAMNKETLLPY